MGDAGGLPKSAMVVSHEGRILYVNSELEEMTGLVPRMTVQDMVETSDIRSFTGEPLSAHHLPASEACWERSSRR